MKKNNEITWEIVGEYYDRECSTYHLEGFDKNGTKYQCSVDREVCDMFGVNNLSDGFYEDIEEVN